MACEVCSNDYDKDKAFQVMMAGKSHIFDSFECAMHTWSGGERIDLLIYCCAPRIVHSKKESAA